MKKRKNALRCEVLKYPELENLLDAFKTANGFHTVAALKAAGYIGGIAYQHGVTFTSLMRILEEISVLREFDDEEIQIIDHYAIHAVGDDMLRGNELHRARMRNASRIVSINIEIMMRNGK